MQLVHKTQLLSRDIVFQCNMMQAILMYLYRMDYVEKPFFRKKKTFEKFKINKKSYIKIILYSIGFISLHINNFTYSSM
jgi:hypothetical protein